MDVLRKELNSIYARQHLEYESLDAEVLEECKHRVQTAVAVDNDCRVITDASADMCYIFGGSFAGLIGLCDVGRSFVRSADSSDEDVIYDRIHPEDLVDKRMLEYEFFRFVETLPDGDKLNYKATCRIRIRNYRGVYIYVNNSTRILHLSPNGKIWLILCCYEMDSGQEVLPGILPRIVSNISGEVVGVQLAEKRQHILTEREKEVLGLISTGYSSKQIAGLLHISIHTVSRHRQNILEKLSVGNSVEAVTAAVAMKLL